MDVFDPAPPRIKSGVTKLDSCQPGPGPCQPGIDPGQASNPISLKPVYYFVLRQTLQN